MTDNIKLPPLPEPDHFAFHDFGQGIWIEGGPTGTPFYSEQQVQELMREAVRLNAQAATAAPQPAQQDDDEGDALTIAYLHGYGKGKDSVQPVLSEKDALLRQALEALENGARVRNFEGGTKYQPPIEEAAIKAIRTHLGAKND
jgi:hypothetical protein